MVKRISTGSPFEAKIGYSRAVVDRDMVYVSGTTGYDYASMTMPDDAGQQARNAIATIGKALAEAGSSLEDVVRVTYYLKDMSVQKGATVSRGDTIGSAGTTGSVSSPQLHFELRKGATPVDPVPLLG